MVKLQIELPLSLLIVNQPNEFLFTLKKNTSKEIIIPLLPTARGSYSIGPIKLILNDPFLMFENVIATKESILIRIYPKRISKQVPKSRSREVFTKIIGIFATRQRGLGTDFHGLRDYIRGDPVKIISWTASARINKLISKEFEEERRLEIIVALAAGTTTRGPKFDFMLGVTMDLYEGFINENHPCGLVIFEDEILVDYYPSTSKARKMKIWGEIYGMIPKDTYPNYRKLDNWINKESITGNLVIIIGDLENEANEILETIRRIRLRGNNCIFIDVYGYTFSFQSELIDASLDQGSSNYGQLLANVIGKGIEQDNYFKGSSFRNELQRHKALYGYLESQYDDIINCLERALVSYFGMNWRSIK